MKAASIPILLVLAAIVALPPAASAQGGSDVAVIVNPNNTVANLSVADLRKMFVGEKRTWPSGAHVKLIVRSPGSHERIVMLRLLGMSESDYKQYWTAQVFRGEADSEPLTIPSIGMVKEAALVFPGAIAFVDAQDVKPGMNLKVIKVEGHLPGDAGYPLH